MTEETYDVEPEVQTSVTDDEYDEFDFNSRKRLVWLTPDSDMDDVESAEVAKEVADALGDRYQVVLSNDEIEPMSADEVKRMIMQLLSVAGVCSMEEFNQELAGFSEETNE